MHTAQGREQLMRRIAVIVGIVIGIVAWPAVVAASGTSGQSPSNASTADKYARAQTWNSSLGQLYGPVKAGPASYGFIPK
jgi:hypothetical protein